VIHPLNAEVIIIVSSLKLSSFNNWNKNPFHPKGFNL